MCKRIASLAKYTRKYGYILWAIEEIFEEELHSGWPRVARRGGEARVWCACDARMDERAMSRTIVSGEWLETRIRDILGTVRRDMSCCRRGSEATAVSKLT